ncbi:thymidylate synthase [Methanococcus vannielii SB]|uniref:Putative thymidylate synthase n=1 Tax=Methanococcus vannielii (strain ATCC 35089 / DSM 1224 / JCM 13029 / OCM 148 / SB) TaxID=406327 RepID=A6UQ23_METVS|nr:thymidylate synthase [Methanococcus vannielii]ABR54595.1 thymidylate synthase [Methanococcus vannielii SB]
MLLLKKQTVKSAFEEMIPRIMKYGTDMVTEDNQKCKEIMNMVIEITNPKDKSISKLYPLGERAVKSYTEQLINGCTATFVYDYHERIFKYPNDLKNRKFDQIEYIVNKLKSEKNSRRAVSITWNPYIDTEVKDVPCLQFVQFLIRDNKLYQTVLFRSNDAFLAFHANAIGLISLGELIAEKLGIELVRYTHHSVSMHVYFERDADNLKKFNF